MAYKIGLLGVEDPSDVRAYSGTPFHLAHHLRAQGHEVRICGPFKLKHQRLIFHLDRLYRKLTGRHIVWERTPLITRQYAKLIDQYADANRDLDFLLATSVFYVDRAKTLKPIFAWSDTTVEGVLGLYPYYSNITARMIRQSHAVEERGLEACTAAIFSSHWAAQTALRTYKTDPRKVHVITYGANILDSPDSDQLDLILEQRWTKPRIVVLVGVEWERKGVDKAIAAIGVLRDRGLEIRLRVVGCKAPSGVQVPDFVDVLGRIPKSTPEGRERFYQLLQTSHAFVLPSVAECAAVSLIEANAYGIAVVASDTGGNASLVRVGENGYLCDPTASPETWADALEKILGDPAECERISRSAFSLYHTEFSWDVAVKRFEKMVQKQLTPVESRNSEGRDKPASVEGAEEWNPLTYSRG